jgi:hypothetical protein
MEFMKKVTQRLRQVRTFGRLLKEDGLINTTDLLVATGATVILAAGVGSAAIGTLDDAKYGKAQPDAQAMAQAISDFYADTGKWPGQAEAEADDGTFVLLVTELTTATVPYPDTFDGTDTTLNGLAIGSGNEATCENNSLQGLLGHKITAEAFGSDATKYNINDYLVRKPSATNYPNWDGPYLQADIPSDPWSRNWVIHLAPLYCAETVTSSDTAGKLGYAWILSGGSNRTVSTAFSVAKLDSTGDDTGVNMGKLVAEGTN